ncbi:MAG TPA: hypothetical protein PKZ36_01150 [Candidatus Paceibacterota bacterium]|nr:hypothetical protein [Candidatus Paceibacterota bacterium]HPT17996.1 hypothetical protein [Candidatus Paceibacterota bacterium]
MDYEEQEDSLNDSGFNPSADDALDEPIEEDESFDDNDGFKFSDDEEELEEPENI